MATTTQVRYTPEDLLRIADRPMPELVDGEFVEREPMGQRADQVGSRIIYYLTGYSMTKLPGVVNGAHGSIQVFPDDPNNVRIPDAAFTRIERLPGGEAFEGHSRVAPDLVVEVISPNDLQVEFEAKMEDYRSAGIPLIWVVNPELRTVRAYTTSGAGPLLHEGDILRGGDILPGFECPVAAFFA
jgi:Uma2 family endonuclease